MGKNGACGRLSCVALRKFATSTAPCGCRKHSCERALEHFHLFSSHFPDFFSLSRSVSVSLLDFLPPPRRIYASAFFPSSISAPPLFRFDFLASWKVVKRCSRNFKQPLSQLFLLISFLRCSAGFSLLPFLSILLPSSGKCAVNFKLVFLGRAELLT